MAEDGWNPPRIIPSLVINLISLIYIPQVVEAFNYQYLPLSFNYVPSIAIPSFCRYNIATMNCWFVDALLRRIHSHNDLSTAQYIVSECFRGFVLLQRSSRGNTLPETILSCNSLGSSLSNDKGGRHQIDLGHRIGGWLHPQLLGDRRSEMNGIGQAHHIPWKDMNRCYIMN